MVFAGNKFMSLIYTSIVICRLGGDDDRKKLIQFNINTDKFDLFAELTNKCG